MVFVFQSSGDLHADRRFTMAMQLKERGDHEAAADLLSQARELAPEWPPLSFRLGECLAALGRTREATTAFQEYLRLDPPDRMGAALELALLGAAPVPEILPAPYVESLFDDYAPRFDAALVERLSYRAPQLLAAAVARARPTAGATENILDLGCGTGLAGEIFRSRAHWLEGIDLSGGMIAAAEKKAIYDRLHQADILSAPPVEKPSYDVILAADVLVYIGTLDTLFAAVSALLGPGGLFAFTTQFLANGAEPFILGQDHRYAHSTSYLRDCATREGLKVLSLEQAVVRQDAGQDIAGHVAVMQKNCRD